MFCVNKFVSGDLFIVSCLFIVNPVVYISCSFMNRQVVSENNLFTFSDLNLMYKQTMLGLR